MLSRYITVKPVYSELKEFQNELQLQTTKEAQCCLYNGTL